MFNESSKLDIKESANDIILTWQTPSVAACPDVYADYLLACTLVMCKINLGNNFKPLRVNLRRMAPAEPGAWNEFFGVPVRFGQTANAMVISRKDATRHLTGQSSMSRSLYTA